MAGVVRGLTPPPSVIFPPLLWMVAVLMEIEPAAVAAPLLLRELRVTFNLPLVDEIVERIAQSVIEFFENDANKTIIERLKQYGIQFEIVEKINPNATNKLAGKTFVVSGVFSQFSRDELKQVIEDNGGKVGSSISAKTDYVVAGENMGPAKLEKANQLKVAIISENDFILLLE